MLPLKTKDSTSPIISANRSSADMWTLSHKIKLFQS